MRNYSLRNLAFEKVMTPYWIEQGRPYKHTREALGMTVTQVAGMIGVSRDTLRKFEQGKPVTRSLLLKKALDYFYELQFQRVSKETLRGLSDWYVDRGRLFNDEFRAVDERTGAVFLVGMDLGEQAVNEVATDIFKAATGVVKKPSTLLSRLAGIYSEFTEMVCRYN